MGAARSTVEQELVRLAELDGSPGQAARTALADGPMAGRLRAAILALARHRGPDSSTCPSDAARAVGGDGWRDLMDRTRDIAVELAEAGDVQLTQRGAVLDPRREFRGPIRIRVVGR